MNNLFLGSDFDDFLREEGMFEHCQAVAVKRVLAYQLQANMAKKESEDVREFDAARYLDSEELITQYLNAALEDGNPDLLRMALDNIAKSTGLGRMLETDWH